MNPNKIRNHLISFFFIATIVILNISFIYSRAGRGGSYRSGSSSSSSYSGSSSSSYSGSSSSSSYSGSSSSSSYSGSSSSSYSGSSSNSYEPIRINTDRMNLKEYNAWITVKENGNIHVYEEFHWKGDPFMDSSGFNRKFPFRTHPWKIPIKSILAKGDVSNVKYSSEGIPQIKITFSPTKRKNALYILEYEIENGFYGMEKYDLFEFPFYLNGSAENIYFEIRIPQEIKPSDITSEFGNYFNEVPHKKNHRLIWSTSISPRFTGDKKSIFFNAKDAAYTGFKVYIKAPKGKYRIFKEDYSLYAMNHKSAEYSIDILKNGIIENRGVFDIEKKFTVSFTPQILFPKHYLLHEIDEDKSIAENLSDELTYETLENLSYESSEYGLWYSFQEKLKDHKKYSYKIRCLDCIEISDKKAMAQIQLPLAVIPETLKGTHYSIKNNATVETTKVKLSLPSGIKPEKKDIEIYLGSYKELGSSFYYMKKINIPVTIHNSSIEFSISQPLHISQRYMIQLSIPKEAISDSSFWAYWIPYLTWQTNKNPWSFYIYTFLILIGFFVVYKIFDSMHESKAERQERLEKEKAVKKEMKERLRKQTIKSNQNFVEQRILANDPFFNFEEFMERVIYTCKIIQDAWSQGNMNKARNFISSGLYNRFRIQIKMMNEQEKLKNLVFDYEVTKIQLNHEEILGDYYAIHVVVTDRAKDTTVNINADKDEIEDALNSTSSSEFTQVYSFLRKKNIQTSADKNFMKNQCPSCGASIENVSDKAKCPYCGNIFNSGEYDWVLAEITQWSEWHLDRRKKSTTDTSIHPQVLEDRVSYLFWQYLYSQSLGDKEILRRHTSASFFKNFESRKIYYTEPVIGSVDFIQSSKAGEGISAADLLIKWSAGTDNREPVNRTTKIRLVRDDNNYENPGFAGASCPSCGAPLPDDYKNNCEFCGADLPKKSKDWLIHRME